MKMFKYLIVLLVLVPASTVNADEATHRKLAEELLLSMDVDQQTQEMFDQMKQMQTAMLKDMNAEQSEEYISFQNKVWDIMTEEMSWEKVKDDYITIYTELFDEEELKEITDFYKSPIGRKFIERMPELTRKAMAVGQKHSMEMMPKIQAMAAEQIKKEAPVQFPRGLE